MRKATREEKLLLFADDPQLRNIVVQGLCRDDHLELDLLDAGEYHVSIERPEVPG